MNSMGRQKLDAALPLVGSVWGGVKLLNIIDRTPSVPSPIKGKGWSDNQCTGMPEVR